MSIESSKGTLDLDATKIEVPSYPRLNPTGTAAFAAPVFILR